MVVEKYFETRARLNQSLSELVALSQQTGEPDATIQNLQSLAAGLNDPLLFVAVGEVKAGKSSLLNALFGQEFCRIDVLPATDKIYIFKYADSARDVPIAEDVTERYLPIEFLKNFNVVDTPGTNTIVASHQDITTSFVPLADLIIFVFSMVNPWAASAWDFLRMLGHGWKKNIVFVLQQADLRTPEEVRSIIQHLEQTILQILGSTRPIFAVSAKQALQAKLEGKGKEDPLWQNSNFGALEDWISATVTQSDERGGKLRSIAQTGQVVLQGIQAKLRSALDLVKACQRRIRAIPRTLGLRKGQALRQVSGFIREMELAYCPCLERVAKLLEERVGFFVNF